MSRPRAAPCCCPGCCPAGTATVKPLAVLVTGAAGSGKSTLGAALTAALRATLLDQDLVTGSLTAVIAALAAAEGGLDDARVATLARQARYDAVVQPAVANLELGGSVVVVAPFTRERSDPRAWAELEAALAAAGAAPRLVWLRCPPDELLRRLRVRGADRDRGKLANPEEFLSGVALEPPVAPHLTVDARVPLALQVESVLADLARLKRSGVHPS